MKNLEVVEERAADMLVLLPVGRLDSANASAFRFVIMGYIATGERFLIVDFSRLDFISGSCLFVLQRVATKLARRRGQIVLCGGPRWVHEFCHSNGLDKRIPVRQARLAAAALLAESRQSLRSRRRTWWSWVNDILRSVIGR